MSDSLAAYVARFDRDDPLSALEVGARPRPPAPPGWVPIQVRAASLNHHDLWTLKGVLSAPFDPPVTLGTDGAGVTEDGQEVIVHGVIATGEEQRLLSEGVDGTLTEVVSVPAANLVPKPDFLSWEEAACLPTAYLTAWRMLFGAGRAGPGERVLVQGSTGGLATAAIQLAAAAGLHVTATSRTADGLDWARQQGAHAVVPTGERLTSRVDLVIDGVGAAVASHSFRSLRPGGRWLVAGVTTGAMTEIDMSRIFWRQLQIIGVTMGTVDDLASLLRFLETSGVRPRIAQVHDGLAQAPAAFAALLRGGVGGKQVVRISA